MSEWTVIAWIEKMRAETRIRVPGLAEHFDPNGLHWFTDRAKNAGVHINVSSNLEWIAEGYNELMLRIDVLPPRRAPMLSWAGDETWVWLDHDDHDDHEDRSILTFSECQGLIAAADEAKRMREEFDSVVDDMDTQNWQRARKNLRENYERLRAYHRETYPHLPPLPDPEPEIETPVTTTSEEAK
jgi:hypothetical protein